MCRILAFKEKERINGEVLKAFVNSARYDPFSPYKSHPDGWGFIILVKKNGSWRSIYYRSPEPIFQDDLSLLTSIKGDEILGIIHARKAGKKFLQGLTHAHPYHARAGAYDLYFAHNGSISRSAFQNPSLPYTDSYMFLLKIVDEVSKSNDVRNSFRITFNSFKEYAASLNSALLSFSEGEGPLIQVGYYYNKREAVDYSEEYFKLYIWRNYVFSSTIKYYLGNADNELVYGDIIYL
ncbi:class II glutamine amidotransferase [Acidianus sp. HS-5]|uniref:class II glutamine amidotransferase n=1 Tax=Acidianus sp. HS-5 TaxID=2886040 RepID=UPI001F22657D|nr:class II glutamine amidotransferase [Acidianus sp. HS-5]BDC19560.1 glutamine amidotransferase [Acidianus sp. HS-5]